MIKFTQWLMEAKLPKNIATMTDAERYQWWGSLSDTDADRLSERTFKGKPEWWVYWAEKPEGETQGPDIHDNQAAAMMEFEQLKANPNTIGARVEQVIGTYKVADADLMDRDYAEIATHGYFPDDQQSEATVQGTLQSVTRKMGCTPAEVNHGNCDEWAWAVKKIIPRAEVWETDWETSDTQHLFVKIGNKFYDAEELDGVLNYHNLSVLRGKNIRATRVG